MTMATTSTTKNVTTETKHVLYVPDTYHEEPVRPGYVDGLIGIDGLRAAIPKHCFQPSIVRSLGFYVRDILFMVSLLILALYLERQIESPVLKFVVCGLVYPFLAGMPATGFWVLGHEAGHGSFSKNRLVGDFFGFIAHSFLMSPFFSWRSTHSRHHVYANHMVKDHNYVPPRRHEYSELFKPKGDFELREMTEDAPIVILARVILQQLIGWPWYLLTNITAGSQAVRRPSHGWWNNSHFDPWGALFRAEEFWSIVASDVGIIAMSYLVYKAACVYGWWTITWTYILPLMWVNHYIVIITYLHHTSPRLPKFSPESWTFLRGALSTVDRDPGYFLRHLLHHIIDLHVVHHLFPRIPHYHAQEATDALRPLLGKYYHQDKGSYYGALYSNFRDCQWVEPNPSSEWMENVPKVSRNDLLKLEYVFSQADLILFSRSAT
ncbi:hypothetical protein H634G_10837 [Metarhizium anisopliae BRIP 53293]|uniref:Fatty acid desaturase domain-containing protein n=1 Tax=Metarhizium anisopliae BRIP 53293 TaxID=1291518 RepID=A0A0D9NJ08_METAN|nr:hypothetical protein H634G_10837 [Metarhizium anisopliae BRIP 53293]KJK86863.1 hypothetical protein H633G_09294 [Metarhizium anisopliae BRIP 53284]